MTAPAITIGPDATIPAAARLINTHHLRRLPVIDADGKLAGIVSRRDLLSVFLRPDADIIHDVRQVLAELALTPSPAPPLRASPRLTLLPISSRPALGEVKTPKPAKTA